MKLKFNWGTGIVLAMIVMIGGILTLVSIALRQDFDLVDNDYYQKSIDYQKHIEKVKNYDSLVEKIEFQQSGDTLKMAFPRLSNSAEINGALHFYSPVEENRDLKTELKLDTGYRQTVILNALETGRYRLKIDWKAGTTDYYSEQEIVIER